MTSLISPSSGIPIASASHLFDNQPICEKEFLGQHLGRKPCLQNAALPRVPIRYLKGYRLRPLADFLFGGFGNFPHPLFPMKPRTTSSGPSIAATWFVSCKTI